MTARVFSRDTFWFSLLSFCVRSSANSAIVLHCTTAYFFYVNQTQRNLLGDDDYKEIQNRRFLGKQNEKKIRFFLSVIFNDGLTVDEKFISLIGFIDGL